MKYYIDFEFNEQSFQKYWGPFKAGKPYYAIDVISVGIVAENGAKFEALNKDANLKAAWNKVDDNGGYWLRENVLRKIYDKAVPGWQKNNFDFTLKTMEWIFATKGADMRTIATEINWLIRREEESLKADKDAGREMVRAMELGPKFVAYFADYDWVCFCTLHGGMMKLPSTYPWYCIDLKQRMDELAKRLKREDGTLMYAVKDAQVGAHFNKIQEFPSYPKNHNEHDALSDAEFDKELDEFLNWCDQKLSYYF